MRRVLLIFAAITVVVAVEIAWLAPATLVGNRIERASGGALRLADTEGTIWHARGMLLGGAARLPLAWDLEFWPLLRGHWRLHVRPYAGTPGGAPRAILELRSGSMSARDVDVVFPASMLAAFSATPSGWKVNGDVALSTAAFEWAPPDSRGNLDVEWRQARLTLAADGAPLDLGNVTINAKAQGDALGGPIRNDGGALSIQGEWTARASEGAVVTLTLAPRADADPTLANALAALGPRSDAGWRLEWRIPAR